MPDGLVERMSAFASSLFVRLSIPIRRVLRTFCSSCTNDGGGYAGTALVNYGSRITSKS